MSLSLCFLGLKVLGFYALKKKYNIKRNKKKKKEEELQMSSALQDFNVLYFTFHQTSMSSCVFGFTSLVFASCLVE